MFDTFKPANIVHSWTTMAGYPAIVVAYPMGHRCGYVQLPDNHPCVGKDYDELGIRVHGELTYGKGAVFGFDCAHYGDAKDPSIMSDKYKELYKKIGFASDDETIKTTEFCIVQCESMAEQFKALEE